MIKMRFNEKSWSVKVKSLFEQAEGKVKEKLYDVAEDLTTRTPVVSGAYAESFSVSPAGKGPTRSRSSRGRPKGQDLAEYRGIAMQIMVGDIENLDFTEMTNTSVSFRNRAPHNQAVEDNHQVFGATKDKHR